MKRNAGFTLMELLVAVGLMVVLMTVIVTIFFRATDVMKINDARINIYENARSGMDILENDIKNAIPVSGGQQRLYIDDYTRPAGSVAPAGTNVDGAADYIGMVTVTTVPVVVTAVPLVVTRELKTVYIEYFLTIDDDAETSFTGKGFTEAQRSKRSIFVLKRRVWELPAAVATLQAQQVAGVPLFNAMPAPLTVSSMMVPPGPSPGTMKLIEDGDLCHWIVSFNIECLNYDRSKVPSATNPAFLDLTVAPNAYVKAKMPLGGLGIPLPGTPAGSVANVPGKLRITLRVIESAGERQERLIEREIWVPLGG